MGGWGVVLEGAGTCTSRPTAFQGFSLEIGGGALNHYTLKPDTSKMVFPNEMFSSAWVWLDAAAPV